jgi:hypothetical protein
MTRWWAEKCCPDTRGRDAEVVKQNRQDRTTGRGQGWTKQMLAENPVWLIIYVPGCGWVDFAAIFNKRSSAKSGANAMPLTSLLGGRNGHPAAGILIRYQDVCRKFRSKQSGYQCGYQCEFLVSAVSACLRCLRCLRCLYLVSAAAGLRVCLAVSVIPRKSRHVGDAATCGRHLAGHERRQSAVL